MSDHENQFHFDNPEEMNENKQKASSSPPNTGEQASGNIYHSGGFSSAQVPESSSQPAEQTWRQPQRQEWSFSPKPEQAWTPQSNTWEQPTAGYPYLTVQTVSKQKKPKKRHPVAAVALIAVVAVILSGAAGFAGAYFGNQYANITQPDPGVKVIYQAVQRTSSGSGANSALSVADVAALTASSVVEIRTESVTTGIFMQQYISEGAGSGVIITTDGYIVTNNHVIDDAGKITVRLKDGTSYEASLIGKDAKTDIAVIKIDAQGLAAAVYGDSSKLVVGETAIAIGNPLGELGGTVTSGIISALDRSITIDGETMTLLQTNAEINPGNSGGGLFNEYGELIGIVNAKSSGSDIEGLGFAIPINTAKTIIEELIENGYVSGRISLGFTIVDIPDTETAMAYRVSKTGVYIASVSNATGGFQAGDRIISFGGVSIDDAEMLTAELNKHKVGDTVSIEVERRNRRYTLELTLQEEKPE